MSDDLTLQQLRKAYTRGEIASIAVSGLVVRFVYSDSGHQAGTRSGYLVAADGAIRRFSSDSAGWRFIESKLKK
ncbi:hypothetical protein [Gilvimarinus chinensis]|uniref:hypothetical protein n=1 Tax=Gilvimarinus chinensis TaxID=396005 RepID=UPI000364EE38|nr:hypothetical protein [Gilvimarinus chinensis]